MCGIAGYVGRPPKKWEAVFEKFMDNLLVETQRRGAHATGVASYIKGNKSVIGKGPVPAAAFIKTPVWRKALSGKAMIAHCRYATHGSPGKNENNHPFESGRWALIHNGVIGSYRRILARENVGLVSECDSETILRVFAKHAGKKADPVAGIQGWVDAASNWEDRYAVALLDRLTGTIRLFRDSGSPCAILKLPALGVVVFASTKEIIADAFDKTFSQFDDKDWIENGEEFELTPKKVYVLTPGKVEVDHELLKSKDGGSEHGQRVLGFSSGTTASKRMDYVPLCRNCENPMDQCSCGSGFTQYANEA